MKPFDIAAIINDREYMKFVRPLRSRGPNQVGGLRRRGILGMLWRAWQESGLPSITGVEVGVKHGSLSMQLLNALPCLSKLVMVDPWREYPQDHPDRAKYGYASRDSGSWEMMYRRARLVVAPFAGRYEIRRTTSLEAAADCMARGERHFFAYIDAEHTREAVAADCRAWWDAVTPGGCLMGDDYYHKNHDRRPSGEQVSAGIEDFAAEVGLPIVSLHRNFAIQKVLG